MREVWVCPDCYQEYDLAIIGPYKFHHACPKAQSVVREATGAVNITKGPGDYLHDAILKWVGEGPTRECGCRDRIVRMNAWGVAGCLANIETIVDWLIDQANEKAWWKHTVCWPGSDHPWPWSRYTIERFCLSAIHKADPTLETQMDWTDCMAASPDLSVPDVMRLIEHAPPGPWPNGWAGWSNVNEAHRVMARLYADSLQPDRTIYQEERGIVIAGGGAKYFPGVWVAVNAIRHFGCTLPIELWYLGDNECDPYMRRLLEPLGVRCIDARKIEQEHPCRILCGWEVKLYAVLHSAFRQALFIDADNAPVRDPTFLFDSPQLAEHGAIFWPDYDRWILTPDVWQIFGIEDRIPVAGTERAFESGQFLIDKGRCDRELRMALWYAEHSDYVFNIVYGDKECFHLGWRRLGADYAMPARSPGWHVNTILQYDFAGKLLFTHHNDIFT